MIKIAIKYVRIWIWTCNVVSGLAFNIFGTPGLIRALFINVAALLRCLL